MKLVLVSLLLVITVFSSAKVQENKADFTLKLLERLFEERAAMKTVREVEERRRRGEEEGKLLEKRAASQDGCDEEALISGPKHRVADRQLTASSEWGSGGHCSPVNSRLYTVAWGGRAGSWCSKTIEVNQWIQVDFGKRVYVTSIATQGRNQFAQWVKAYTIAHSDDGLKWTNYREGGVEKTFRGNWDSETIQKHRLYPFEAEFVRLYVKDWHKHPSLRWEVYGCRLTDARCSFGFSHYYSHGLPTGAAAISYTASCYKFDTDQQNWLDARWKCIAQGGDLVSIETAGEQHHLETVIQGNPTLQQPVLTDSPYWGYWTSGTDEPKEGSWKWAATGRSIGFSKWRPGEPANRSYGTQQPENCLQMARAARYSWNDKHCMYNFNSFICEKKPYK